MKKQIDNTVRDMTPEEEREWMEWRESITPPDAASAADYDAALNRLGVGV